MFLWMLRETMIHYLTLLHRLTSMLICRVELASSMLNYKSEVLVGQTHWLLPSMYHQKEFLNEKVVILSLMSSLKICLHKKEFISMMKMMRL